MAKENGNNSQENDILVVGLGASAGGLEALRTFFKSLPDETGMAFIVVLHLAPDQKSKLAELLQSETSLKVSKVTGPTEIKREHVYVIPPAKMLSVENNHLELSEPETKHAPDTIDLLFRTLAQKKKQHAAGVILSGTGTDGSMGMKAIKEHGGIAIAQEPDEVQHPGMPQSAIKTGVVDIVLPVVDIAEELVRYKENLFKVRIPDTHDDKQQQVLSDIFGKIRSKTGHDFNNYRRSSVLRRIDRRMRVNHVGSLSDYADYLDEYPDEVDELFKDLLISVTNFFRDPEAFEALEEQVIPKLFEGKNRDDQVRVWVPGCATGEEAYSIAMLLKEYATEQDSSTNIQVFATDIDEEVLDIARKGIYPDSIAGDIPETRLHRFLIKEDNTYRVRKEIREMVLFASHDLLRTPPFSKQDLITCRNLLIYLNRDLQSEVFNLFHYALRPEGWLFLGSSDSRIGIKDLFTPIDKDHRIYRQKPSKQSRVPLPDMPLLYNKPYVPPRQNSKDTLARRSETVEKMHWGMLVRLYAPQSVLITLDYEVIHSTDGIKKFMEYAGGEPSSNILDMVKPEIRNSLRNVLFQFKDDESLSGQKKVRISLDGQLEKLELIVRRFSHAEFEEGVMHVIFKEISEEAKESFAKERSADEEISEDEADYIESLERELEYTKEQLQLSIEEYETSIEELRASNEELQSMNEELQTTTEELETSQEELRSMNEELSTLNEELENKVEELSRAHSDLENLMEATEVGIIFVDNDYRVQRFTSTSTEIFNLIESDEGRPLDHITHLLEYENMMDDVKHVLENLKKVKKVVQSSDGRWFIMRVRPYRSTENKIEGVVLTFTEFTELKEVREKTIKEETFQESLATLGIYALEKKEIEAVLKRAIDIGCLNLELDCAVVYALDEDHGTFEISAQAGCAKEGDPLPVDKKWDAGFAFENVNEPTIVTDYKEEKRFSITPYLDDKDIVSSVHLVARGAEDTYGLLGFYSYEERVFNDTELHFLQTVANIVGMAIQQRHAREELKKQTERSLQYQKEILHSSVVERWELGGYLHDNLGQMLASAKIILTDVNNRLVDGDTDVTSEIAQVNEIIDEGIEGIRDLTHDIIPVDIEEEGVEHGFRFLMRQTQRMYDVNCMLETDKILDKIKDRKLATHLYYIVQEAVKNASVHGEAENIVISVKKTDGHLTIQVKDDGIGLANAENENDGKGIRIMKHRMELIGGSCKVEDITDSGQTGTCVTCSVPLDKFSEGGG